MGETTKIQWTHHTFNTHWGCQRVSPGCEHCYAETFSKRVGLKVWGPTTGRRFFGDKHWAEPLKWNRDAERAGERHRVFCASMGDILEDRRDLDPLRARLRKLVDDTPWLDWLLLTKRPENAAALMGHEWLARWPSNVWAGTTTEDAEWAEKRIRDLLVIPAAVRFLSCEPLLGPIDLVDIVGRAALDLDMMGDHCVDWVIVGGESGHGARPFDLDWARATVSQCKAADVACFVKQLGADPIDGLAGCSVQLRDRKGGDWSEWPDELRVREFPRGAS